MAEAKKKISFFVCVALALIVSLFMQLSPQTAYASDVSGFSVKEAQVRKHSISGIRFVIEVNKAEIEALGLDGEPEYGAVLLPEDMLGENELTLETANVLDIKKNKWYDESETSYAVALVGSYNAETGEGEGLPESYYNRPIAARGYVKGTKNGEAVVYYTTDTLIRSLGYVAAMHLATGTEDASNELIKSIAEKTDVKVSLESKTLVSGKDKLLPEVSFGGVTVPMSISKAFDFTYSITGDALKLENGELIASNVGSAEVKVTLNALGKAVESEETAIISVIDSVEVVITSRNATVAQEVSIDVKALFTITANGKNVTVTDDMIDLGGLDPTAPDPNKAEVYTVTLTYTAEDGTVHTKSATITVTWVFVGPF